MWCFCLIGILCVTTLAVCSIACRASGTEGADAATSNTKSNTNSATTLPDCTEQHSSAANSQTAISAMMLEGRWELYNAIAGNTSISMTFDTEGDMWISRYRELPSIAGVEALDSTPLVSYDGSYQIAEGNKICFTLKNSDRDELPAEGFITAGRDGNFCIMTFGTDLMGIANEGHSLKMFNTNEMYPVTLPDKPSVLEMFKSAVPFIYDRTIKDAATLIINGKQPTGELTATKAIDIAAGYLAFNNGGAPSSGLEACIWRCQDGTTLLAINVMGESPEVQPTHLFRFFRYYPDHHAIMRLDGYSENIFLFTPRFAQSVELPRKGTDIKLHRLNEASEIEQTETIRWDGNNFIYNE